MAQLTRLNRQTWGDYERDTSKISLIDYMRSLGYFGFAPKSALKDFLGEEVIAQVKDAKENVTKTKSTTIIPDKP